MGRPCWGLALSEGRGPMLKLLSTIFVFFLITCSTNAQASNGSFCHLNIPQVYIRSLQDNDKHQDLIHEYYPREFSDEIKPRFSTTAEEQGHYILGDSQQTFRYYPTVTITTKPLEQDSTKVLVSSASRQILIETIAPKVTAYRPPRINDSLDIPRVIEEHAWIIPELSARKI